ncbi:MAG: YceI family protein [Rickettsiales bacterium]|nr:YceI family protein [Rickettsiales bacterium]
MKKFSLVFFLALFSFSSNAADVYKLDPNHTNITWSANHFGFSSPSGKFTESSGTIILDELNPSRSQVEVTINTASINTGIAQFDGHLKGANFLNSDKFPTATFTSTSIQVQGDKTAKVQGNLNLLGVTKPITLDARLNKIGISPVSQKKTAGFTIKGTIRRSDFGMNFAIPGVSDEVKINIEVEAILAQSNAANNAGAAATNNGQTQTNTGSWNIDKENSKIEFVANQDNSSINGSFKDFSGNIIFYPKNLAASKINMTVNTNSANIALANSTEIAKSSTWLDAINFPQATFATNVITQNGDKNYVASGILKIKNKSMPVSMNFTMDEYSEITGKASATGSFSISRSAFGVGDQDPRKANNVKDNVTVNFVIKAVK